MQQSCSLLAFGIMRQAALTFVAASIEVEESNGIVDFEASILRALSDLMDVTGTFVAEGERLLQWGLCGQNIRVA